MAISNRMAATFLLLSGTLCAQIGVSVSVISHRATEQILNRRAARILSILVVAMQNDGTEPIAVSESAVIRQIPQLQPFDSPAVLLQIQEAQTNDPWARASRLGQDALILAAYAAGRAWLRGSWPEALATALAVGPYIVGRISGQQRPVLQNFLTLAWGEPVKLEPGDSATKHIFCQRWSDASVDLKFTIPVTAARSMRLVQ